MAVNMPVSPSAPDDAWSTGVGPASPVVSPSPPGGGTPETPDVIVSPSAETDTVAASVAQAVANATSRYLSHQQATFDQGSQIGASLPLPPVPCAESKHTGPPPADGGGYPS